MIDNGETIRSYRRRFWMLFLFSMETFLCGFIFPQYISMANITMCFYGVDAQSVNWTSLINMVTYVVFVFPASWMIGRIGLRQTCILGSVLNTAASAVQFLSLTSDGFKFVMLCEFLLSLANVLVMTVPPHLAAVWFPSKEVSRACAVGIIGNQAGIALGFAVPPYLISSNCMKFELIADGKRKMATILTSSSIAILLLIVLTFQNEPCHAPSTAQAEKKNIQETYRHSVFSVARNLNFILILIVCGLVVGTFYATGTLLNSLILHYFSNANVAVGWMGLTVISTGIAGSIICGYVLDYAHKFKETSIAVCMFSFTSHVVFSCLLPTKILWLQFVNIGILGFFLTSFLPVNFEYGIEVTYPASEIVSAGLLNMSSMTFGIILTEITSSVLESHGPLYSNAVLSSALFISAAISYFLQCTTATTLKPALRQHSPYRNIVSPILSPADFTARQ